MLFIYFTWFANKSHSLIEETVNWVSLNNWIFLITGLLHKLSYFYTSPTERNIRNISKGNFRVKTETYFT